jgi:uncharacterized alkaline shock family protein YloU
VAGRHTTINLAVVVTHGTSMAGTAVAIDARVSADLAAMTVA